MSWISIFLKKITVFCKNPFKFNKIKFTSKTHQNNFPHDLWRINEMKFNNNLHIHEWNLRWYTHMINILVNKKLWMICDGDDCCAILRVWIYMRKRWVFYCGGGVRLSKLIFDEVSSSLASIYHNGGVNE